MEGPDPVGGKGLHMGMGDRDGEGPFLSSFASQGPHFHSENCAGRASEPRGIESREWELGVEGKGDP